MDVTDARIAQTTKAKDVFAEKIQKMFKLFLTETRNSSTISDDDDEADEPKYSKEALELLDPERSTLFVDFRDLMNFDQDLANIIIRDYLRFYPCLCRALASFIHDETERTGYALDQLGVNFLKTKDFFVGFYGLPNRTSLRELRAEDRSKLVKIVGQVVRTHSVYPELLAGAFECLDCGTEILDVEQNFKYTQPTVCRNNMCGNRTKFKLLLHKSNFVDFQRVRIQELQQDIPRGAVPRNLDIIFRASDQVEAVQPGDRADFIGCMINVPNVSQMMPTTAGQVKSDLGTIGDGVTGLKGLGVREMTHKLIFLGSSVILEDCDLPTQLEQRRKIDNPLRPSFFSPNDLQKIKQMSQDKNLYDNIAKSVFPSIFGNDNIKKGIILQMFSGVPKVTEEGTNIRGDINICIVGDPSCGKSQFLKIVSKFAPTRAIYTSGKASTAAGLTAAVVRDEDGGFVIEAGALMLADQGICCIDEFDKMDVKDQVAIHEAMEQQTISITKAGVKATLNARTSVLAAANPIGGTYNRSKSLRTNLSLSLPIMSRFDLFFILLDECNETVDLAIAERIMDMHETKIEGRSAVSQESVYNLDEVRNYIRFAKQFKPKLTLETEKLLVDTYKQIRLNGCADSNNIFKNSKQTWRITVRQLESLIRLSEALAKMYCSDIVEVKHVKEASRLLNQSILKIDQPDVNLMDDDEGVVTGDDDVIEDVDSQHSQEQSQPHQSLKITFEMYRDITNILVYQLKYEEERIESGESEGLRKSQLVTQYLEQVVGEIDNTDELIQKKLICEKVIEKLVNIDHVLIELDSDEQKADESMETDSQELERDPILVVHPQFAYTQDF